MIKTRGIVLGYVKYGESAIVSTIYTEQLGRQSFLVKGVRGAKHKELLPLLIQLSIVEIEVTTRPHNSLQHINNLRNDYPLSTIPFDPIRRTIAMFMGELLQKALRPDAPDKNLFEYVTKSIQLLDEGIKGQANFHLYFMFHLTRLLGFEPDTSCPSLPFFDLQNGVCVAVRPFHNHFIMQDDLRLWIQLSQGRLDDLATIASSRTERIRLVEILEHYYMLHIAGFSHLNSYSVLSQLCSDM